MQQITENSLNVCARRKRHCRCVSASSLLTGLLSQLSDLDILRCSCNSFHTFFHFRKPFLCIFPAGKYNLFDFPSFYVMQCVSFQVWIMYLFPVCRNRIVYVWASLIQNTPAADSIFTGWPTFAPLDQCVIC